MWSKAIAVGIVALAVGLGAGAQACEGGKIVGWGVLAWTAEENALLIVSIHKTRPEAKAAVKVYRSRGFCLPAAGSKWECYPPPAIKRYRIMADREKCGTGTSVPRLMGAP